MKIRDTRFFCQDEEDGDHEVEQLGINHYIGKVFDANVSVLYCWGRISLAVEAIHVEVGRNHHHQDSSNVSTESKAIKRKGPGSDINCFSLFHERRTPDSNEIRERQDSQDPIQWKSRTRSRQLSNIWISIIIPVFGEVVIRSPNDVLSGVGHDVLSPPPASLTRKKGKEP